MYRCTIQTFDEKRRSVKYVYFYKYDKLITSNDCKHGIEIVQCSTFFSSFNESNSHKHKNKKLLSFKTILEIYFFNNTARSLTFDSLTIVAITNLDIWNIIIIIKWSQKSIGIYKIFKLTTLNRWIITKRFFEFSSFPSYYYYYLYLISKKRRREEDEKNDTFIHAWPSNSNGPIAANIFESNNVYPFNQSWLIYHTVISNIYEIDIYELTSEFERFKCVNRRSCSTKYQ